MDLEPLAVLRADFCARGWNRKPTGRIVGELAFHLALALGGIVVIVCAHGILLRVLGFAVTTFGTVGVTTNTHTSSHHGTSRARWLNDVLTFFGYPLFVGVSATYWRHAHVAVHHPAPNVMGVDDDADFSPFFASTDREVAGARGWYRHFVRMQWVFFPLIVWVHVFLRQRAGLTYLFGVLRDPQRRRTEHVVDALCLLAHAVLWYLLPMCFFPWTHVVAFNLVRVSLLGYPLFCVLAPGHYPAEAPCIASGDWPKDFVLLQTTTTMNFRTGWYGSLLCSGLQYQIEHHLFPGYSHAHYAAMSPYVEAFCEREGYPYRTLGWSEAVWKVFRVFHTPKQVFASPDAARIDLAAASATPRESPDAPSVLHSQG